MDENLAYAQVYGTLTLALRNPSDDDGVDPLEVTNLRAIMEQALADSQKPKQSNALESSVKNLQGQLANLQKSHSDLQKDQADLKKSQMTLTARKPEPEIEKERTTLTRIKKAHPEIEVTK